MVHFHRTDQHTKLILETLCLAITLVVTLILLTLEDKEKATNLVEKDTSVQTVMVFLYNKLNGNWLPLVI